MKKKRLMNFFILIVFLISLIYIPAVSPVKAQTPTGDEPEITRDTPYIPGEVVIGFEESVPEDQFSAKAAALAGEIGAMVVDQSGGIALLSMDPDADVFAAADQLGEADGILFAEPNYISWIPEEEPVSNACELEEVERSIGGKDGETITISVDELLSMRTDAKKATYPNDEWANWGNSWIAHEIIWSEKKTSPRVCVVDTGVDYKHPDLRGRVVNGYDFVNNDGIPNDDNGHGTHVAGTIAAKVNNGIGPAGISNGKVLAVKVLGAQGWGTDYNIAKGIEYCANNNYVKVINMSLGGSEGSLAEWYALDYAINVKGKLVVAAAGNAATSERHYPAAWADSVQLGNGLLSVGAIQSPFG